MGNGRAAVGVDQKQPLLARPASELRLHNTRMQPELEARRPSLLPRSASRQPTPILIMGSRETNMFEHETLPTSASSLFLKLGAGRG